LDFSLRKRKSRLSSSIYKADSRPFYLDFFICKLDVYADVTTISQFDIQKIYLQAPSYHGLQLPSPSGMQTGSITRKVLPTPSVLLTSIFPPLFSIIP